MSYAIQAEGLVKRFGATKALDGVDLAARTGTVLGVLGPNGAGKTTAVRVLSTLLRADAGHATVGGYDVAHDAHQVRRLIGLTGQYAAVDEELTGTQNLVMIGRLLDLSRGGARERAASLLDRFGLADASDKLAKNYSGGMRRRLDLAASLVGRPQILYLDEPTTGLDPHSRSELWGIVRGLVSDGVTVLLTTQHMDEADQLAHDIVVIDHGNVIASGTPDELKTRTGGQHIDVRPVELGMLDLVADLVTELTGQVPQRQEQTGLITAPIADPALLPELVRRLDDRNVVLAELSLRRPSLDEVFLTLTGHGAVNDTDDTDPESKIKEGSTL
ncbi:MAG TPA: ATP-binding cassette domain-containing protein [Streptosporangiaceae bacterium]|jgi:oleandomycin transport system ATP-binding protein